MNFERVDRLASCKWLCFARSAISPQWRYAEVRISRGKRIEQRHAGPRNVGDVTGDKRQSVYFGCRCQEPVDKRQRVGNVEPRPDLRNRLVDRKHRSPSLLRICANHRSSAAACSGSARRFSSIPRRISARTTTLVPMSVTGVRATQRATLASARSRFRIAEMTLVSSKNFTD